MVEKETLRRALQTLVEPTSGRTLGQLHALKTLEVENATMRVCLEIGFPVEEGELRRRVQELATANGIDVGCLDVARHVVAHRVKPGLKPLSGVKNILAVGSAKGGVGKSTVAVNLALSLAAMGASVGVLDADIHGPSVPLMLGVRGRPASLDGKSMQPLTSHGLQVNSIGFFVEENEPVVWRGPMVAGSLKQLAEQTAWEGLDYLVVDMPPGTGDVQLTLSQSIPVTAAIVVTTPQQVACEDTARGLRLFEKVGIPVLGIIENMAYFKCPGCGRIERIFGQGGAQALSGRFGIPVLGELPLVPETCALADEGVPAVLAQPSGELGAAFAAIALRVASLVAGIPKDMSDIMPRVRVEPVA